MFRRRRISRAVLDASVMVRIIVKMNVKENECESEISHWWNYRQSNASSDILSQNDICCLGLFSFVELRRSTTKVSLIALEERSGGGCVNTYISLSLCLHSMICCSI